jgi:hypothetical protein
MAQDEDYDVEAGNTPKMNKFAHEISDWLMVGFMMGLSFPLLAFNKY